MKPRPHVVPASDFQALATGLGRLTPALAAGQRSKRLLLLTVLREVVAQLPPSPVSAQFQYSYGLLERAHRIRPDAVDPLLLHPFVGAWAISCLRSAVTHRAVPADLGQVGGLAAVAAWRVGLPFELTTTSDSGILMMTGVAAVKVPPGAACRICWQAGEPWPRVFVLPTRRPDAALRDPHEPALVVPSTADEARLVPVRRVRAMSGDLTIDLALDDLDPYRGPSHLEAAPRLSEADWQQWQGQFTQAWELLVAAHRERARALAEGLMVAVPLLASPARPAVSATRYDSVGAFATTPPRDGLALAQTMIHEFQHSVLTALQDLVPLQKRGPHEACHYSPWRPDPRPLAGLLHGTYAFLAVGEFWERQRRIPSTTTAASARAHFEFARCRAQVARALAQLTGSAALTPAGARFVEGLARQASGLRRLPVPAAAHRLSRLAVLDHELCWRLTHCSPTAELVDQWVAAWRAGRRRPASRPGARPESSVLMPTEASRLPCGPRLMRLQGGLTRGAAASATVSGTATSNYTKPADDTNPADDKLTVADSLLVTGRGNTAAEAYVARISACPTDLAAWSGLALSRRDHPRAGSRILQTVPELVYALYLRLSHDGEPLPPPHPDTVVAWVAGHDVHRAGHRSR